MSASPLTEAPEAPAVDARRAVMHAAVGEFRRSAFNEVSIATVMVWNGQRMLPLESVAERFGAVALLRRIVIIDQSDPAGAAAPVGAVPRRRPANARA